MTRSRGNSRVRVSGTRNLARVVVAGLVLAGSPLALAGTANATGKAPTTSDDVWDKIAQCESGGKWNTSTGNGFSGGLQFTPSTWHAYGGKGSAHGASRGQQIAVAERVLASQGWGAWPSCSKKVGAKGKSSSTRTVSKKLTSHSSATRSTTRKLKKATRHHSSSSGHSGGGSALKDLTGDN